MGVTENAIMDQSLLFQEQQPDVASYYNDNSPLHRLVEEAPYLSRCSDNKTASLIRPREYAIRYPYMQVNRRDMVSWLVFDLDHSNSLIWDDEGLPEPNLVVRNRNNGHSHLYYAIPPVCTSEKARQKPIAYMKAIYETMAMRLQADPSYSGPVAKTPGHPWWYTLEVHNTIYSLGELADYLDLSVKPLWSTGPDLDANSHSRHCLLFEELRFYAYSIVSKEREEGSYERFVRFLDVYAHNKNNYRHRGFDANLTVAQVKATIRSVARWTWNRYTGTNRCNRGIMALDESHSLTEKQQLAAARTHTERKKASASKVRSACHSLAAKGDKLTFSAIAVAAGVSRQTVAKYREVIDEFTHSARQSDNQEIDSPEVSGVNYGVYQISAPLGVPESIVKINQSAADCQIQPLIDCSVDQHSHEVAAKRLNTENLESVEMKREGKKITGFGELCKLCAEIERLEFKKTVLSYENRGRLVRTLMRYEKSVFNAEDVIIDVASRVGQSAYADNDIDEWVAYLRTVVKEHQAREDKFAEGRTAQLYNDFFT